MELFFRLSSSIVVKLSRCFPRMRVSALLSMWHVMLPFSNTTYQSPSTWGVIIVMESGLMNDVIPLTSAILMRLMSMFSFQRLLALFAGAIVLLSASRAVFCRCVHGAFSPLLALS